MGIEWWTSINQDHRSTLGSFAQWRYSNQWSNREVLLLLVENYTQYPAISTWNIVVLGNFWKLLQEQSKFEFRSPTDQKLSIVKIETFQAPVKGPCENLGDFM